jgi:hypothetical protein
MDTYNVSCHHSEHFTIPVKAYSEEEALGKALKILEEEGVPEGSDVFDRDFDSVQANKQPNY